MIRGNKRTHPATIGDLLFKTTANNSKWTNPDDGVTNAGWFSARL